MISGEQFQALTEISFCKERNCIIDDQLKSQPQNVRLIDEFPVTEISSYKKIFIYSHDVDHFFNKFGNHLGPNTTIVTHNSDIGFEKERLHYLDNPNIVKWFAQNRAVSHGKLFTIPIGIANSQWSHGNKQTILDVASKKFKKEYFIYKNFDIGTNYNKRTEVNRITLEQLIPMDGKRPFYQYLEIVAKTCFVISPPGNGVDCHRIWECLSLGTVPVVEWHECYSQFEHLPIVFIKDWHEVNIEFLRTKMPLLEKFNEPIKELDINYWRTLI